MRCTFAKALNSRPLSGHTCHVVVTGERRRRRSRPGPAEVAKSRQLCLPRHIPYGVK
jgi:hypothetical protein